MGDGCASTPQVLRSVTGTLRVRARADGADGAVSGSRFDGGSDAGESVADQARVVGHAGDAVGRAWDRACA